MVNTKILMVQRVILVCMPAFVLFSAAIVDPRPASALAYADPGTIAFIRPNVNIGDEIRLPRLEPGR